MVTKNSGLSRQGREAFRSDWTDGQKRDGFQVTSKAPASERLL